MYRLPARSTATPAGKLSIALVAGPPSPLNPAVPVPATVVTTPLASTLRTGWAPASAICTAPSLSTATLHASAPGVLARASPPPTVEDEPFLSILTTRVFSVSADTLDTL